MGTREDDEDPWLSKTNGTNIKTFFLMLVLFMHRISVFDFFFIPKIHEKHFKSGLTIKIKPRQHVSPLFYTVGTVYSDVLCKNVCFLNRFLGILCPSLHTNRVLLFNEEHCEAAYSNVGEILIAATQWQKILHCKFFNEH